MNTGELIDAVQYQFGDTSEVQISRATILSYINLAQIDIVRETEILQEKLYTDSVKDDGSYDFPEKFVRLRRVTYDGKLLQKYTLEELDGVLPSRDASTSRGFPVGYYTWGTAIYLHPIPDTTGARLEIYYLKLPDTLVNDTDIPEIPEYMHEDLIRYALARAKELDEEDQKAEALMAEYQLRIQKSKDDSQNKESDTYSAVRALPGDEGSGGFW